MVSGTTTQFGKNLHQTWYMIDAGARKFVITTTQLASDTRDLSAEFESTVKSFRVEG